MNARPDATPSLTFQGRTYRVGDEPCHQPALLPAWFPPALSLGWRETPEPWYGLLAAEDVTFTGGPPRCCA